jgi:hypothetical protein
MRLRFFLILITPFFSLSRELALSQSFAEEIPIAGVWTQDRPPYGIDTLKISGDSIIDSYVEKLGDQPRQLFGRVLYSVPEKGHLIYIIYKVMEGGMVVPSVPHRRYMVYEVAETELWTYTDSVAFPDRAFLKANAYRNTWKSKSIQQYRSRFYNTSRPECVDSVLYSIYDHRGVTAGSSYVTIPPKFPGGVSAYDAYVQQRFIMQESLEGIFGMLTISCTISCNGTVSRIEVPGGPMNDRFPNTLGMLKQLVSQMPNWIPAFSDYRNVPCRIELPFLVANGTLHAGSPR